MKLFEPFRLDIPNQCLWRDKTRVPLMPKPFAVLRHLVEHAGQLVTQDELLGAIWPDTYVQPEVLRKYILEIRRVLDDRADLPRYVATLPRRGYQFIAPVTDERASDIRDLESKSPTRLVGREAVRGELDGYLSATLLGQRHIVFVTGEAGIGKTSLVDAFQADAARVPNVMLARGQAVEGFGGKETYYPILEALGQLTRTSDGTRLIEILRTHAPTWLLQLPSLVRAEHRQALHQEALGATPGRMVREICEALEVFTEERPLVLVLEDLHWADPSTLDVLSLVARRRGRAQLLVLATYRPVDAIVADSPLKTLKRDLLLHRLGHEVALEPLEIADIQNYLEAEFGSGLPRTFVDVIGRHSEGNPLFMRAMLSHLVQQGVLRRDVAGWTLTLAAEAIEPGVPDTLKQMLQAQIDSVGDAQMRVLQAGSVAGQRFSAWSVGTMLDIDRSIVEELCDALAEMGQLLRGAVRDASTRSGRTASQYEFRHALYRELLYRRLPATERVKCHRRLAVGLEALRTPGETDGAAELAAHFEEGQEYTAAVRYLIQAARNVSRRYAHADAVAVLDHALALLPLSAEHRPALELEILETLGEAAYALGDVVRSAEAYTRAAARAGDANLPDRQAHALIRLAGPSAFFDPDGCLAACERAAGIGVARQDAVLESRGRLLAACWRMLFNGWHEEQAAICRESVDALQREGIHELAPYDRILLANVQIFQSEHQEALANTRRGLSALTDRDGLWERVAGTTAEALALIYMGHFGDAHRRLVAGIDVATKNGNGPWLAILKGVLATLHLQAFDFDGVRSLAAEVLESDAGDPPAQVKAQLLFLRGLAELWTGETEAARQSFTKAQEGCETSPRFASGWYLHLFARLGLIDTWLVGGDVSRSTQEAERLGEAVLLCRDSTLLALAWDLRSRCALAAGRLDDADKYVRNGLAAFPSFEVPLAAWRVLATAWRVQDGLNNAVAAEDYRQRAEAALRRLAGSLDGCEELQRSLLGSRALQELLDARPAVPPSSTSRRRRPPESSARS